MRRSPPYGPRVDLTVSCTAKHALILDSICPRPWEASVPAIDQSTLNQLCHPPSNLAPPSLRKYSVRTLLKNDDGGSLSRESHERCVCGVCVGGGGVRRSVDYFEMRNCTEEEPELSAILEVGTARGVHLKVLPFVKTADMGRRCSLRVGWWNARLGSESFLRLCCKHGGGPCSRLYDTHAISLGADFQKRFSFKVYLTANRISKWTGQTDYHLAGTLREA